MLSRAELWEQYKPKLAEAKEFDRLEGTLVFLAQPAKIGRFRIALLTLERLLWLEAIESPFVTPDKTPGRMDVLNLLWVMSPFFRPGRWRRRVFVTLNIILNWKWYALEVGEHFAASMELQSANRGESDTGDASPMWVAQTVDGFCSQYHWPMRDVLTLPLLQMGVLSKAMGIRLSDGKDEMPFGRHADRAKADYLKTVNKIDADEKANGKPKPWQA